MADLSYQEKSIWATLLVMIATAIYFFGRVFGAMAAGTPLPVGDLYRLGFGVVVIIIAAEIALHVAIALRYREKQRTDERDALIAAKAARNAYYVLIVGLMILGGHAALSQLSGRPSELELSTAIVFVLFALVVSEVWHYASQLFYYRRGI